jgi:predicted O-methyltransferase YrrM
MNSKNIINPKSPVWSQIESLVENIPGWTPIDELYTLFTLTLANANLVGDIVEVGSWCGRSAVVLAAAARLSGDSNVYCADLFPEKNDWKQNADGTYSFEVLIGNKRYGGYIEQTVWKEVFESQTGKIYELYNGVLDCFQETISQRDMSDIVHAYKGDLAALLESQGSDFKCRVAFLDGDHGYEAVCADIRDIERCLVSGGWLCFDDAFSCYLGVNQAIEEHIIASGRYDQCQQMTRKLFVARRR